MASPCARNWCFTWQVTPDSAPEVLAALERLQNAGTLEYLVCQLECAPTTGQHHYQGYVQLPRKQRLSWLKRHVSAEAHWEVARGTAKQNRDYCTKEDSRVGGPWEWGTAKTQGQESGIEAAVQAVKEGMPLQHVAEQWPVIWVRHGKGLCDLRQRLQLDRDRRSFGPEGPELWVLHGSSGTGKSRFVAEHWPDAFWKIPGEKWWDGYDEHETVVLDDFKVGELRLTDLQRLLDWNPLWVEVKGGAVPMLAKRYVITSNYPPSEWYPKADVHGTILRRVHDFASVYGRLIDTDVPDWRQNAKVPGNTTAGTVPAPDDPAWEEEEIHRENEWMDSAQSS